MKIDIKSRWSGAVLFSHEAEVNTLLNELERLAKAATPGPWTNEGGAIKGEHSFHCNGVPRNSLGISSASYSETICKTYGFIELPQPAANAAYIAACSPDTVLRLIAEVAQLRAVVAAADAIAQSMSEGLETEGDLEHDWSIQDRALIVAYDTARAKLKEPK